MTEFAFVLPIFVVLLLAIMQFGIAFNNYITLTDATRAGARKAAVSRLRRRQRRLGSRGCSNRRTEPRPEQARRRRHRRPDWTTPGSDVTVSATYPYSVYILGWIVTSGTLTSTTKERLE